MLHAIVKVPFFRAAVRCLAAAALVFAAPGALAQEALVPLPSVKDFTRGGGLGLAVGGSFKYAPAYIAANQYDREWRPAVALHWRRDNFMLFWENRQAGLRTTAMGENMLAQLGAVRLKGRESRHSEDGFLNGLDKRDDEYAGVAEVRLGLGSWRHWAGGRLQVGNRDTGTLGSILHGSHFAWGGGMGTEVIFSATFATAENLNRDFGVTPEESMRAGNEMIFDPDTNTTSEGGLRLPAKNFGGGFRSVGLKFVHRRDISRKWHLIVEGGAEVYGGALSDSPVARESRDFNGGATLLYRF